MKKFLLSIPDMHCPSCEKLIHASIKDILWINEVNVLLENRTVDVEYDDSKISPQKIISLMQEWTWYVIVEKKWDKPQNNVISVPSSIPVSQNTKSSTMISIDVVWMHCSSCALLVEKSLKKVHGVESANVNFSSSQAMIKITSNVSQKELLRAVENAWYAWSIHTDKSNSERGKRDKETKHWKMRFIASLILSLPMIIFMLYDFFPSIMPWGRIVMPRMAIISLVLTIPIQFVIWADFFKWARSAFKMKTFNMYSLIAIGTWVTFIYSLYNFILFIYQTWSWLWLDGEKIPNIYFEVSWLLIMFVILWKLLEAIAKWSTSQAIARLMWLAPKTAKVKKWNAFVNIAVDQVVVGDIILVKPWERIPIDWTIVLWHSSVDESMLTWESMPVEKIIWSKIFGWTINTVWSFEFKVTKVWKDTALAQIIQLIQEA